jgi:WD40 repeat protein
VLKGHTDCVCAVSFGPPDSFTLATGSFDQTAKWWNLNKLAESQVVSGHGGAVTAVSASQGVLITGGVDGTVRFDNQIVAGLRHRSWVNSVAVGKAGTASGSSDGTVRLVAGGKTHVLEGGAGEVRSIAFSPDDTLLAAGNRYGTVRIWDVATQKELKTITGHMGDVWSIAFSPDGKTLAAVDTDWKKPSKIKLYDTATWKERGSLDTPGEILSIAYSPKGDYLAAGCWDKTVRVFAIKK